MEILKKYQTLIINYLQDFFSGYSPEVLHLYSPVNYALEGGKKIRPVSVLLSTEVFDGDLDQALIPAFAVEMFHNFTLLHDDVMDNSPVRRNRATVHSKWNMNQAILSGDAMMTLVYQKLLFLPDNKLKPVMQLINRTALQVCEGQQLDLDFENNTTVSLQEYLQMIRLKTAVLLAASLSLGAIISDASGDDILNIYDFGINIGLAFQLQDDYFDTYADYKIFGKKIGNDIINNKKTFLLINALERANNFQKKALLKLMSDKTISEGEKISKVKHIFNELDIPAITKNKMTHYYNVAIEKISFIKGANPEKKALLNDFAKYILKRAN